MCESFLIRKSRNIYFIHIHIRKKFLKLNISFAVNRSMRCYGFYKNKPFFILNIQNYIRHFSVLLNIEQKISCEFLIIIAPFFACITYVN